LLTRVKVGATPNLGARDHYQCYDGTWRLASLRTGSCSRTVVTALGYDVKPQFQVHFLN